MNKIFRVIYSQATQSWVVVSELTKAHKKQSSSNAQKSAVNFSGNFIKSSAIALALLSGHSAYAALNDPGTGSGAAVAWGTGSQTTTIDSVAIGKGAKSENANAIAIGGASKASGDSDIALGNQAKAEDKNTVAIGRESKASGESGIALGYQATADKQFTVAIGAGASSKHNNAVAIGKSSQALGPTSLALGMRSKATGNDSYAIGLESESIGETSIAFGYKSKASKNHDIVFGREAGTRDKGSGYSIAIGYGAMSGTQSGGKNLNGNDAGGVAIGTGAYTGVNQSDERPINSGVAIGAGAGAGYRAIANGLPTDNATDADNNAKVLVKAFGGTTKTLDYFKSTGNAKKEGFFSFQGVNINEGTALGRNARAIGDQSVAIGAQSVAGQGSIVIGGNDIQAYEGKKYFKAANPTSGEAATVNDYDAPTTPGTGKNGQPITIRDKYKELVGEKLDSNYRSSYGQDGSTVIGMQAHSTTPLGVAIGTNSIVRKGAFGATAIGSGASVVANAEAAVAIGMGSEAQGNYAVAAGTGAKAEESAVAAGYQANADKSAVAVGDSSKAATSSVAVGQLAKAEKVADIAVGQGAVASGEQGAIAMGLGTNARGDSSIMIGGADVDSASKQSTTFEKAIGVNEKGGVIAKDVVEKINGKEVTRHYTFAATKTTTGTVAAAFQELTGHAMDVATLNFADTKNKNGHASTSLGVHSLAKGDLATAIGASARADVIGSLALGTGAHATLQNAVAIGTGSTTELLGTRQLSVNYDSEGNIVSDDSKDIAYTFKWAGGTNTSEGDVVSFGSSGAERQLKNVAAGRVAEDSTDAINGSQLNSITKKIAAGFNTSGNVVTGSSGEFTSKKANTDSADKAYETAIRSQDKVQLQVGNNLKLDRDETEVEIEVQDDFDKTKTVKKKVKKADFAYSLNPVLTNLTSAEFKADGKPTVNISSDGITITPAAPTTGGEQKPNVSLTENGLNNGGNAISNVKSNLPATKNSDTANTAAAPSNATKTQAVPNTTNTKGTDYVNPNNAATVGDVLNAGWNLKGKGTAVDFVKAYDTVDFVDGDGTTASVESKDGQTSTVKYSVNTTKIKVDTANVGKVKAEGTGNTFATAETVASAINDAYWKAAASGNGVTTDVADNVKAGDTVTFKAGKNLTVTHNNTNKSFEFATTDTPEFSSVQFGNNGPKITNNGNTIKVSGANGTDSVKITNVADGKDDNDAVNVSQLKASGWNIAGNGKTKVDTINKDDQVNFLNGSGTTVTVEKDKGANGKETGNVNVKYDVNVGNGLQKDTANNTISVKPADSTITVGTDGVKVNTGDIATESTGKATTALDKAIAEATKELAEATEAGDATAQQKAQEKLDAANKAKADAGKQIATVENVTEAINKAGWNAIAAKTENGEVSGEATQLVKPGETVIFEADKNIKIAQNRSKFTFSTKDNVEFKSVKVGEEKDGKKPVNLTTDKATDVSNNDPANKPTTALNVSSDGKPTQITGVGSTLNVKPVDTNPNGTATTGNARPNLIDLVGTDAKAVNKNAAATVGDLQNMGWVVSSDKATGTTGEYKDVVKNANEVKFVGKNAAKVSGKTENGVRTITVDVEVPDVKTAKLVSSTDGSVIAPSTDSKLQDALKTAKDELAALPKDATDKQKKEAEKKVEDAETALNKALDDKGVATAKNVADMINNSGFTLKTSEAEGGKKDTSSTGDEVINPGKAVEMVAGKNLTVKQEANGKVTYSLNPELINLTSAEFKADGKPTTKISSDGIVITPNSKTSPTVSLTENGLNNGGNHVTNVKGNLPNTVNGAPGKATTKQDTPETSGENAVKTDNAATVGDILNAGWNIQEKGTAKDFVKAYDTVNFDEGNGTSVSVGVSEDGKTSTVKYSVKADGNSLEVGADGVKVKVSDGIETTTNGIAVKAADKTLTVGKDGIKVNTGAIAAANGGDDQTINRGKVTVTPKTKADGTTETQAEAETRAASEIATVKNVADAINSAAWIAKVENTDDSVDTPTKNDKGTAVKAGDTLNLKAGKNLRVKRDDGNITFALAKDITVETANVENTLTIGKDGTKVNIASGANGLTLAGTETAADGSTNNKAPVYLNGIKPTLTDTLAGGTTAHLAGNVDTAAYHRAASVQDVLNAGWNIRGVKQAGGEVENVDFVRTYDTVDFVSGNKATTDVTVTAEDGGKRAVVTITAKNDAGSITTADGKVVVGTNGQADTDSKAGDKVAKTGDVANAINQSGWKTNATKIDGKAATDANKTQLINPGDAVNYENGNGTVANVEVKQGKDGNPDTVSVKYDVKADGTTIKVGNDGKVTAVTGETEAVTADADGKKKGRLKAKDGDGSKLATVESVANAVNSAKWYAKANNNGDAVSDNDKTTNDAGESMAAGDELTLTAGKNLRVKREGGKFTFATVETPEFEGLKLVQGGNTVNIAPTANGLTFSRPAATAGGKEQPVTLGGISSGLEKFDAADPKTGGLLNLNKTETGKTEPAVSDNTAATVGDLRAMGWVLSADKKTDNPAETYNAQVKNAEEVKFVGASGVTVSGKTDGNVRTITVGVDHQLATNNSVKPVEYTKKDGTKVYPKTVTNGGKTETKFYPNADGTGDEVPAGDVIVSVNGANGTKSPTTLSNVKSNLPETRNTADAGKPASKSQSAPTIGTADGNVNTNNAATVGDVLNSGWNLKGNGSAVDFVRAYDTVNFVNGKGTTVSIETDGAESRVKVDVDTGVITAETKDGKATGKVAGPVANAADLSKAIKDAQDELAKAGDEQAKKAAQTKLDTANKAADEAGLNKVATAQNVADMINNSGFTLKTSATAAADNLTADNTLKNDGEVINPGKAVEMIAGKNLTVKQDAGGKVTYATKDDVEFATVKIGEDKDGKKPVSLTTEKAVNATSNNETGKEPATALKISSDGKPAQLVGVASVLNTSKVTTKPDGDKKADGTPAESKTKELIDLAGTKAAPVNKNAAATVGDLQNMGWVVSTKDGNGYTDVVRNADKVDFKGSNGIEVRGSTAADGTRVITVSAKEGKVTNKVEITKTDGSKVNAVIIDGKYYEDDGKGKPKTKTEIPAADIKSADNGGSGFVTGNTVANAINKSGWNVGLAEKAKADAAFGDSKYALDAGNPEKVNPDDNIHFANGNNTVVKAATVEEVDKDGKTVTNTYIRVDAKLPISQISAVDENGNKVVKDADGNWYPGKADGTADKTQPKVDPAKVRQSASMDPENKGDRYTPLAKRSDDAALTVDQKDALSKQQDQYAKAAADKIAEQLKGQSKAVIEAAQKAAAEVARVEAKDKYLKDNGLDKGIGGTVITNVAWGQKPDDAVNVDQLQNSGWNLDSKAVAGSSGKVISGNVSPSKVKMDETVNIDAGNNIEITRNGKNIGIATSMTPQFSSVSLGAGADAPTLSVDDEGALNVGSKDANKPVRITNVAPGVKDGDVANVAQLKGSLQNLNNRIDNVDGNARAGIAQAIATAGLVQAYLPGKSMMAIGGGTYRGEAGYAIGYSSISDGGNWVIKGTASGNSRGHFGASASVGYQW